MLELWGRETSSNVQAVRWALLELGVPFIHHRVGGEYGGLDRPEFRALTPVGKIPVIVEDGLPVFESAAILRYLAARHGGPTFWPEDFVERTRVDVLAEWAKRDIADAFTGPVFWRAVRTHAARRDAAAIRAAIDEFEGNLAIAERQLERHEFLAGRHLTPGDIHLGHVLYRYFDIDIARRDFPAVAAYYRRLAERPPYREAVMISYDALRDTI